MCCRIKKQNLRFMVLRTLGEEYFSLRKFFFLGCNPIPYQRTFVIYIYINSFNLTKKKFN